MLFKSKTTKNFSEDNYWIEGLQNKVDKAWSFATDVVDIVEEIDEYNQNGYKVASPHFRDIEVRITSAYDETGNKLTDDYKNIIFKNVKHKQLLGRKYMFNLEDFSSKDVDKYSTWLDFNFDTVKIGSNGIIRRCNCMIGMLVDGDTKEWYEPAILDYDPKYTISYFNEVVNIPKAETYLYVQFNEYTKNIRMSDRFIIGALDFENKSNNAVYKVKEVFKFGAKYPKNPNSIPMIILSLERDVVNVDQDLISLDNNGNMHYIADYYKKKDKTDNNDDVIDSNDNNINDNNYYLKISPSTDVIYQGESLTYECYLYDGNNKIDCPIIFNTFLEGPTNQFLYYDTKITDNSIEITNLRKYFKNDLILECSVDQTLYSVDPLSFSIQLGEQL